MAQTNYPSISTAAEVYTVIVEPFTQDLKILNGTAQSFIFRNVGTVPVYFKYGLDCNTVIYTHIINPNTIFADSYGGLITGCVYGNISGLLLVTLKI
jgi:hypothetical protein